jgi:tRNA C32,U32 (ribose-2'-O)-methylase TrmJ
VANKKIYTKSMNLDGTVAINLYELKTLPTFTDHPNDSSYITREEFDATIAQLKNLYEQLLAIKE